MLLCVYLIWSFINCAYCCCSIEEVLHHIDNSIQYGEDADVKVRDFEGPEDNDDM